MEEDRRSTDPEDGPVSLGKCGILVPGVADMKPGKGSVDSGRARVTQCCVCVEACCFSKANMLLIPAVSS